MINNSTIKEKCECLVIGSGPSGSVTAAELAEQGKEVVVLESGMSLTERIHDHNFEKTSMGAYGRGLTVAFGPPNIHFMEAQCVGGGSEINAGLYSRLPEELIDEWREKFQLEGFEINLFEKLFDESEKNLGGIYFEEASSFDNIIKKKATSLDLQVHSLARFKNKSVINTFLHRAKLAGAEIINGAKAIKAHRQGENWLVKVRIKEKTYLVKANSVFLCAGATRTASFLRASGIKKNVGNRLKMHPFIKVLAVFKEPIFCLNRSLSPLQYKSKNPFFSLGSSISTTPILAATSLYTPELKNYVFEKADHCGVFYCMIPPKSFGQVKASYFDCDPIVFYKLSKEDLERFRYALQSLCRLLFESGATFISLPVEKGSPLNKKSFETVISSLNMRKLSFSSPHLFSSCPMGGKQDCSAVDSFGRVHNIRDLIVNDSSILCDAPGVNPLGSIMALSLRNTKHYLGRL